MSPSATDRAGTGDDAFAEVAGPCRDELQAHCYRFRAGPAPRCGPPS